MMDEPCSAIDPIAKGEIEETDPRTKSEIHHCKPDAQHAASAQGQNYNASFTLGRLIELDRRQRFSPIQPKNRRRIIHGSIG